MTSDEWITLLKQHRAIAIIRSPDAAIARRMAEVAIQAGMGLIEITWNSGNAPDLIHQLTHTYPNCMVGAGTILSLEDFRGAIAAGAQFAFSPHTDVRLIHTGHEQQVPLIPGGLSPTEILTAWQAGATAVKIFPIKTMGGVDYLRCLQQPLGHIPVIPTGGVTLDNAGAFLQAGAIATGISSHLFPQSLLQKGEWATMQARAIAFVQQISQSRELTT